MEDKYVELAVNKTLELLAIDSPTGYCKKAISYLKDQFEKIGFETKITNKGGLLVDFGGQDDGNGLLFETHVDTLGAMVSEIKSNGRLKITNLGGMNANNAEGENVRIITRDGKIFEGTAQLVNASIHVNGQYNDTKRNWDNVEVVIDELVKNKQDVKDLSIEVGDIVCFEPRSRVSSSGYIKSRFLDDKLSVGMLVALAHYLADKHIKLSRKVYGHVTVFEEVGHGGSGSVPEGVSEAISIDMGCVGEGLNCSETEVSICAKDSGGPYSYDVVSKLIEAAKKENAKYCVDFYPHYGSDVEATVAAGADVAFGLIGSGVYASHGYERSHKEGVKNTLKLIKGYLNI